MVGTRTSSTPQPLIVGVDAPAAVLKLQVSGSGGRRIAHPSAQKTEEVSSNVGEELNVPVQDDLTTHQPSPDVSATPPGGVAGPPNIIVNKLSLCDFISANMCCKHCAATHHKRMIHSFLKYCDEETGSSRVRHLWRKFACQNARNEKETYLKCPGVSLSFASNGLATFVHSSCNNNNPLHKHAAACAPERAKKTGKRANCSAAYALNLKIVLAALRSGGSHEMCIRFTKLLGLPFVTFKTYKVIENVLGNVLKQISEKSMTQALEEEIKKTKDTYRTERYGLLPAIAAMVDMGWQKRAAGRSYNSPSGVLHAVGGQTGKIVSSYLYRNNCCKCQQLDNLVQKRIQAIESEKKDEDKITELTEEINELEKHECLKNFTGPSKSMETDAIVQLIKQAPEQLKCYVRTICLDDDTITRSHIKEDMGPKSKGCLPKDLAGVKVVADPSHRKRTVTKWYYALANKLVGECALKDDQAKTLGRHFGYFQNRIKTLTLEDAEAEVEAPMLHLAGKHEKCGEWCLSKRAENEGKSINKLPMFDLRKPRDEKTWREVREVFEKATTRERLIEMIHQFTTQPNESLNMRAAQVAPKAINYSRTESLTYRIAIVICHHNLGHFAFYTDCFDDLAIEMDEPLMNWLKSHDEEKMKKKKRDESQEGKRKRAYKYEAKAKDELYKEATKPIKMGTYKSGVVLEDIEGEEKGTEKKQ